MKKKILLMIVLVAACIIVYACSTPQSGRNQMTKIVLTDDQMMIVEGGKVSLDKAAEELKAAGFENNSIIRVVIPDNTPQEMLSRILKELTSGGYKAQKIFFTGPQKRIASVGTMVSASASQAPVTPAAKTVKPSGTVKKK